MATARITFHKCRQESQELGTDDEHLVGTIFFSLEIDGKTYPDLSCTIKQTTGARYHDGPVEVSPPVGYGGAFNHEAFRREAEKYYRQALDMFVARMKTPPATGIVRVENVTRASVKMERNTFSVEHTVEFEVSEGQGGW